MADQTTSPTPPKSIAQSAREALERDLARDVPAGHSAVLVGYRYKGDGRHRFGIGFLEGEKWQFSTDIETEFKRDTTAIEFQLRRTWENK